MNKTFLFFLFAFQILAAQNVSGHIYDIQTKEPLIGATIYLDGTTLGTTTNFDGYFQLNRESAKNVNLIVSFMGYSTRIIAPAGIEETMTIQLTQSTNQLNEVDLGLDIWSREKKMRIFKTEFLGKERSANECKIINEKDIILIYNSSDNTLSAYADKPILVKNKYLGYEVKYNLVDFVVKFSDNSSGLRMTNEVYYAGTSFFTELKNESRKRTKRNRMHEYYGSLVHFMRSLANKQLTENSFAIYHKRLPVAPYKYFHITKEETLTKVELTTEKVDVLYNGHNQSSIEPLNKEVATFQVDYSGNHSPPNGLIFGGTFGQKRISSMLPLNYNLHD